ncbi:LysM peptidoglycan-binding domain-containing protein [Opitutus sp. GAS368]|uniref:Cell division protein CpoB n=1 Tax=Opitutus sp. GAS368 TaxID=1882749 RepID=UPI00087D0D70|nr:LysM peptidoglycan-binding domain-containing protein [Opitutus sp. GAS368]SDS11872.1 Tetratricopeptide repeat-containing protein [Opitutus sp. GAS368]
MRLPALRLARLLRPLLGLAALWLAGCSDSDRVRTATEIDEPGYREGQALLKSGRRQEALSAFLKVVDLRGDDAPESHLEIGLLYAQHINDPLSAIYHFRKYLALRPNSPQAPLVRQRIDAATREFARTLPAQPLENQLQRVDLVATLDKLKQENEALKQELADVKAGRNAVAASDFDGPAAPAKAGPAAPPSLSFNVETIPTVRTRPVAPPATVRPPAPTPARPTVAAQTPVPTASKPTAAGRTHTVQKGDTLSKISQQYYGNRTRVKDLYAANRGVMKSETDLKIGVVLKIP